MTSALRDKDYVRTAEGYLFNVTGYDHPPQYVYASLKYTGHEKWTHGYEAARRHLACQAPHYVRGDFICVPTDAIVERWEPQTRLLELTRTPPAGLLGKAVQLAQTLSDRLEIPVRQFGVTDSLLWGSGHEGSDIDLVVVGRPAVTQVQRHMHEIYTHADFARPDPLIMQAPYGRRQVDWAPLLARKWHMGVFADTLFSLRGVRESHEPAPRQPTAPAELQHAHFEVARSEEALFFPAIYYDKDGNTLVDYTVVLEGVFQAGDVLEGTFAVQQTAAGKRTLTVDPQQLNGVRCHFRS